MSLARRAEFFLNRRVKSLEATAEGADQYSHEGAAKAGVGYETRRQVTDHLDKEAGKVVNEAEAMGWLLTKVKQMPDDEQ